MVSGLAGGGGLFAGGGMAAVFVGGVVWVVVGTALDGVFCTGTVSAGGEALAAAIGLVLGEPLGGFGAGPVATCCGGCCATGRVAVGFSAGT